MRSVHSDWQNGFPFRFGYRGANFIDKRGCCSKKIQKWHHGEVFVHVTLRARKNIARRDFHFLLCAFVAVLLKINQILDRLIIQLGWYILRQLFTSVSVKMVDISLHFGE